MRIEQQLSLRIILKESFILQHKTLKVQRLHEKQFVLKKEMKKRLSNHVLHIGDNYMRVTERVNREQIIGVQLYAVQLGPIMRNCHCACKADDDEDRRKLSRANDTHSKI